MGMQGRSQSTRGGLKGGGGVVCVFWFRWRGAITVLMRLFYFAKERLESDFKLLRGI